MKYTYPLTIIYQNSLLDHALKELKYSGETMPERFPSAQHIFKNKNRVWNANWLRNEIADDVNMERLSKKEMKEVLQSFRQAFVDLGALQCHIKDH